MATMSYISLFEEIKPLLANIPVIRCAKTTLIHVSHTIENIVFANRLPGFIFAGFQQAKYWQQEAQRYISMLDGQHQVYIFTGEPIPDDAPIQLVQIRLDDPDPLRQEWFLIIFTDQLSVLLCGRDRQTSTLQEGLREFDTFLTFETVLINQVLDLLVQILVRYDRSGSAEQLQAARNFVPEPSTTTHFATLVINEMLRYESFNAFQLLEANAQQQEAKLLRDALERERQLNEVRVRIMITLSHEFRTPLSAIMSSAEMLDRYMMRMSAESVQERLDVIKRQVTQMDTMLTDLLVAVAAADNTLTFDPRSVNPVALLTQIVNEFRGQTYSNHVIKLTIDWSDGETALDEHLLRYILTNLLSNAAKYSPETQPIDVRLSRDENTLLISVTDGGSGIAPHDLPHIFEAFYRSKSVENIPGSGLGLKIVLDCVNLHGGKVEWHPLCQNG